MADPGLLHIKAAFEHALDILDSSEAAMRDAIENDLMEVTGPNSTKRNLKKVTVDGLMKKIVAIRMKAVKDAFKHLRDTLPHEPDFTPDDPTEIEE
jgi:hypothetical protein